MDGTAESRNDLLELAGLLAKGMMRLKQENDARSSQPVANGSSEGVAEGLDSCSETRLSVLHTG